MAQVSDYTINNDSGANVRADLNNVFAAIQSLNSGSSDPAHSATVANMLVVNTTSNLLKIVNGSNNGFITIGNVTQANLGLAPLAGATFTGKVTHNYLTSVRMPQGDTSERGSSANGDFRYNNETHKFEGYQNGAWGDIGGGGGATGGGSEAIFHENENQMDQDYTIGNGTANINAGVFGPLTINATLTIPATSVLSIV
tara:strand:+ start:415 stop:1011 length:597 start_codon:yes stop_codon:yes gene_type:complete